MCHFSFFNYILICIFLLDLPHQVQQKRMSQSQKNKNHTKKKRKRGKSINLRKESIIKRRKRRDERKKVHLLTVQTVQAVTDMVVYFCFRFCREDDFPFIASLFMLCNAVLKWDIYIFLEIYWHTSVHQIIRWTILWKKICFSISGLLILNHATSSLLFLVQLWLCLKSFTVGCKGCKFQFASLCVGRYGLKYA